MGILGISASGRNVERNEEGFLLKGVTEELVKYILKNSGEQFEYVSLKGKNIMGCQGCLKCAGDNICVQNDDWAELRDKMFEADAVVFGAPNYYGAINAVGHAFLERTFSLRHRNGFALFGKANVIVIADADGPNHVEDYIQDIFRSNYMAPPIGILRSEGVAQCYTCGYGEKCTSGAVVDSHGLLDEIKNEHLPIIDPDTYKRAEIIAIRLGEIVRKMNKS
ncbi:MAG TPA: flavodoxin family protein [Spirochaetes bacterium]|nr:flavodoxin family protein [Spirochaetota bacterium]